MTSQLTAEQAAALILDLNGGDLRRSKLTTAYRQRMAAERLQNQRLKERRQRYEQAKTLRDIEDGDYKFDPTTVGALSRTVAFEQEVGEGDKGLNGPQRAAKRRRKAAALARFEKDVVYCYNPFKLASEGGLQHFYISERIEYPGKGKTFVKVHPGNSSEGEAFYAQIVTGPTGGEGIKLPDNLPGLGSHLAGGLLFASSVAGLMQKRKAKKAKR